MIGHKSLGSFALNRSKWQELMRHAGRAQASAAQPVPSRLREIHDFGSNPGALRMFTFVPPRLAAKSAPVVVLHGCTQTAAGYEYGAGWSTLAERYGFALLAPEQQPANNPKGCFNWFEPGDIRRGAGEALSIRQMIEAMVVENDIDRRRVFVTGLSAGGAMTSVMLACYPEVFAAGAIVAGLPYGCAANVQQALDSMFQSRARSTQEWGDLVRSASPHRGPWPRVSIWHGGADKTVVPNNAREILKQWTDLHGLSATPSARTVVDGYPRQVWHDAAGAEAIESYAITHMAHGTPLATGEADDRCGAAGPFLLDVGISSSYHIAKFFGLANAIVRAPSTVRETATLAPDLRDVGGGATTFAKAEVLEGEVLDKESAAKPTHTNAPPSSPAGISAVINRALTAAGLMKGR